MLYVVAVFLFHLVFSLGNGLLKPPGRFMYCLASRLVFLNTPETFAFGSFTCLFCVVSNPEKPMSFAICAASSSSKSSLSSATTSSSFPFSTRGGGGGGGKSVLR